MAAVAVLIGGCEGQADPDDAPATLRELKGELRFDENGARVIGSFRVDDRTLTFRSLALGESRYEVTVTVNGATLTALGDARSGYHLLDGFSTANGEDTQLTMDDRELILSFNKAYDLSNVGKHPGVAGTLLERATSLWTEHPDGLPLQREVISDPDRDITWLCGAYLAWQPATHDCSHGGDWGGGQWGYASIGERGQGWPDGQYSHHYYDDRPQWGSAQPHKGGSFWAGSCLGRCGPGCPAVGNLQIMSQDCANHDVCGTGNHNLILGIWCQDEAAAAADDALSLVVCDGTGSDPQWILDWESNGFPNQGP